MPPRTDPRDGISFALRIVRMARDLIEIHERLQLAHAELERLGPPSQAYLNTAVENQTVHNADGSQTRRCRLTNPVVPTAIRSKIGTIVNEMRACLDALACVLAGRNQQPPKNVYFPISKSEEIFRKDGIGNKIAKLSQTDRDIIESLRPWRGGNHLLFGLHSLDILRKHQRLALKTVSISHVAIVNGYADWFQADHIGDLTEEWTNIYTVGGKYDVAAQAPVGIAFAEPDELKGLLFHRVLIATLNEIDRIVTLFD
jgi:hypothetical protein